MSGRRRKRDRNSDRSWESDDETTENRLKRKNRRHRPTRYDSSEDRNRKLKKPSYRHKCVDLEYKKRCTTSTKRRSTTTSTPSSIPPPGLQEDSKRKREERARRRSIVRRRDNGHRHQQNNSINNNGEDVEDGHVQSKGRKLPSNSTSLAKFSKNDRPFVCASSSIKVDISSTVRPPINDDRDGHLIYQAGDLVLNRYEIVRTLGEGTFGKVVQVTDLNRGGHQLAIKIIKNVSKYREAAKLEINVLNKLMEQDPDGKYLTIQLLEYFDYYGHMCLVFDLLALSVFDFMVFRDKRKINNTV